MIRAHKLQPRTRFVLRVSRNFGFNARNGSTSSSRSKSIVTRPLPNKTPMLHWPLSFARYFGSCIRSGVKDCHPLMRGPFSPQGIGSNTASAPNNSRRSLTMKLDLSLRLCDASADSVELDWLATFKAKGRAFGSSPRGLSPDPERPCAHLRRSQMCFTGKAQSSSPRAPRGIGLGL